MPGEDFPRQRVRGNGFGDKLRRQDFFAIALELDLPDLLQFCLLNQQTVAICQSNFFWQRKLQRDYPAVYDQLDDGQHNYRQIYMNQ